MEKNIDVKVKNLFKKSFTWFAHYFADQYFKASVLGAMQKAYDLGRADGYAQCYFDEHPELENE